MPSLVAYDSPELLESSSRSVHRKRTPLDDPRTSQVIPEATSKKVTASVGTDHRKAVVVIVIMDTASQPLNTEPIPTNGAATRFAKAINTLTIANIDQFSQQVEKGKVAQAPLDESGFWYAKCDSSVCGDAITKKVLKPITIALVTNITRRGDDVTSSRLKKSVKGVEGLTAFTKTLSDVETVDRETTIAEPNDYITATRKNLVSSDNKGRMVEKCIVEIQGAFLVKIRDYAFNGNIGENAFKHIDKFLKVVGPIKINGLTQNQFRLSVERFIMKFHHLSDHNEEEETEETLPTTLQGGDAEKQWNNEINGTTITWSELSDKFFHRYYPLSHTCNSKIPDDLDNGTDYLKFIYWLASKFDNYWEIDKNTRNGLWEFYMNKCAKGMIGDLDEYKEPCKRTCLDTFYRPYLDAQEANDIYEAVNREYSWKPIPARRNIDNADELCRTKEFTVIRHSISNDEEFVTVGPIKVNTVERTPGSMNHMAYPKDLAETMIWYILKRTCVELIWAF
ncbi:hypothetical protein Tco_1253735 [Tanacetum coccineum]